MDTQFASSIIAAPEASLAAGRIGPASPLDRHTCCRCGMVESEDEHGQSVCEGCSQCSLCCDCGTFCEEE